MRLLQFVLIVLLFIPSGCGVNERLKETDTLISEFQTLYNAQSFSEIYAGLLHPEWHDFQSEEKFKGFMENLHAQAGARFSGERINYSWKTTTKTGTTVVVAYRSEFQNGTVVETFTFRAGDSGLKLLGYNFKTDGDFGKSKSISV